MNETTALTAFDYQSTPNLIDFFKRLVTSDFMPHGHCFFWRPDVLWLHVISDLIIALAYYSIPITLIYFVHKKRDIPFHFIFIMFGAFIFLCGTTHIVDIWTMWVPVYRLEGAVKAITAAVSLLTAIMMIPIMPKAISFPSMEQLIRQLSDKGRELSEANQQLQQFNKLTMGRETRILELKKEVNSLSQALGRPAPYDSAQ